MAQSTTMSGLGQIPAIAPAGSMGCMRLLQVHPELRALIREGCARCQDGEGACMVALMEQAVAEHD